MDHSCCSPEKRKTIRPEADKERLIRRLNRIEGQIKGIGRMLEQDAYCADVLTQAAAAKAALESFGRDLLELHIRSCVVRDIRDGGGDETISELLDIIKKTVNV